MKWLLLLLIIMLSAPATASEPVKAAASIFPLADVLRQVGGDRIKVITLLPAGASEHTFEPTTAQMRQISDVSVYVHVGAGMDIWADRLIVAARTKPVEVTATSGIDLLPVSLQELVPSTEDHGHEQGDDPHVWLDPVLVRDRIVPAIVQALSAARPADAHLFKENGRKYSAQLTKLHEEMKGTISKFKKRDFIAMHSAWGYLAKRYGLHQVAAVEPFPGKEPSARYLAALVKTAKKRGVTTIFAEQQLSPQAAEVIASEIGGKVLLLDPLGGDKFKGRDSYLNLMRYNLAILAGGMS